MSHLITRPIETPIVSAHCIDGLTPEFHHQLNDDLARLAGC